MTSLAERVRDSLRKRTLLRPGERVAVAVSGGADSLALLRLLLELREDLGIVLSVAHFHHGIRGIEADLDRDFVADIARRHELELHSQAGDALAWASAANASVESAARTLRYRFFSELLGNQMPPVSAASTITGATCCISTTRRVQREPPDQTHCVAVADRVATAHTLDDQAETVLMKLGRGAGIRGLAGIFAEQKLPRGSIVRPLLEVRREELRSYLRAIGQDWREDSSNADLNFTRNRVRARVLPVLRADLNLSIENALAHTSAIAQADEEYWDEQIARILPLVTLPGTPARGGGRKQTAEQSVSFNMRTLQEQPLAVQRRVLRAAAEHLGCNLDFEHVESVRELMSLKSHGKVIEIAGGWRARRLFRELRIEKLPPKSASESKPYEYKISVPGAVYIAELGTTIRARICKANGPRPDAAYNRAHLIDFPAINEISVRNWRPGDRFRSARSTSEKRVKELLYALHLAPEEKALWPVATVSEQIVWIRGIDAPEVCLKGAGSRLVIEESGE